MSKAIYRLISAVSVCLLLGAAWLAPGAHAEDRYPSRRITWIVPYGPGGGGDLSARILAQKLSEMMGQAIVVENRGGAGGVIGTNAGAKAAPDGYTWTMGSDPPFTINPHLMKLPFDPVKDFEPVSVILKLPLVLVINPALPAKNVQEFVALAKARPGSLTIGSSGSGSSGHLAAELLKTTAGVNLLHVPFKDQASALSEVMSGRVDATFSSIGSIRAYVEAGKLRAVGVATASRFEKLPDLPTIAEQGYPGFEAAAWQGLLVPAGTPKAVVATINARMSEALKVPDVARRLTDLGLVPVGGSPEDLVNLIKTDSAKWAKVIQDANIKTQ